MGRKGLAAYSLGIYTGLLGMGNEGDRNLGREKALGGEGYSAGHSRAGLGCSTLLLPSRISQEFSKGREPINEHTWDCYSDLQEGAGTGSLTMAASH